MSHTLDNCAACHDYEPTNRPRVYALTDRAVAAIAPLLVSPRATCLRLLSTTPSVTPGTSCGSCLSLPCWRR